MRRLIALLLLIALIPGLWVRETRPRLSFEQTVHIQPLPLPSRSVQGDRLGAFTLEGVWTMDSRNANFGGYSALVPQEGGRLLAISDRGFRLLFSPPGEPYAQPRISCTLTGWLWQTSRRDAESATTDPATGTMWIGWESDNEITRHGARFGAAQAVQPQEMQGWRQNTGPEAMVRLADGRFIVLGEGFTGWIAEDRHPALLFADDPVATEEAQDFTFSGPVGFNPTDMAQLPDGRVLVLMRDLVWPLPARFEGRIALADPADLRPGAIWKGTEVARLSYPLPIDNFEGMAIVPRPDGTVTVWLISDDNNAVLQRTLLWKLRLDPAALPATPSSPGQRTSKKAHG